VRFLNRALYRVFLLVLRNSAAVTADGYDGRTVGNMTPPEALGGKKKGGYLTMEDENERFDAGAMVDEGAEEAGITPGALVDAEGNEVGPSPDEDQGTDSTAMARKAEQAGAEEQPASETKEDKADADTTAQAAEAALAATDTEAEEVEQESEEDAESQIAKLLPQEEPESDGAVDTGDGIDHSGKTVPVEAHKKLRQRTQRAEQERDEALAKLRQQDTGTGPDTPGAVQEEELSPVEKYVAEFPEEVETEGVPGKVQAEQVAWERQQRRNEAQRRDAEAKAAVDAQMERQAGEQLRTRSDESEKAARTAHKDYAKVTKAALAANLISPQERAAILRGDSPAEELYNVSKQKLDAISGALGIKPEQPATEEAQQTKAPDTGAESTEETEGASSDDELFEDVFGKKD
jgi:hypothetical protein